MLIGRIQGKAEYQRALQQAAQIRAMAEAEAERIARTGIAQAIATEEQVAAYGGSQYMVTQQVMSRFAEAIQKAGVDIVPRVVISGGSGENGVSSSNLMEGLLTLLLSDKLGVPITDSPQREISPMAEQLRAKIRQGLAENREGNGQTPPTNGGAKAAV